jgi:MFS transporter, putative metabolite:H+ symporter
MSEMNSSTLYTAPLRQQWMLIVVASLGYFVDIYDLVLFNVVKKESLEFINVLHGYGWTPGQVKDTGIFLFNMQMTGMLVGGLLWGIWGDKQGRKSVLFGSILLYSLANIVNAFTFDVTSYAIVRVIAGIGLAGELGAGITLISETMSKEQRGYGTMIIVTFGALGAVLAAIVGTKGQALAAGLTDLFGYAFQNWQVVYLIGGSLGLLLLLLRAGTLESGMFKGMKQAEVQRGNFFMLFQDRATFVKYLSCILIGVPIWYIIGCLVALSQEVYAKELGLIDAQGQPTISNGTCVMYAYLGLSVGDLLSGLLSQVLRSRKAVVYLYLGMSAALTIVFLFFSKGISPGGYYLLVFLMGVATGYWAIFVTIASEQFGTNIRSTVTTTVPNFVRGSVTPITLSFSALAASLGNIWSAAVVGLVCIGLALVATMLVGESFGKDLDYFEDKKG